MVLLAMVLPAVVLLAVALLTGPGVLFGCALPVGSAFVCGDSIYWGPPMAGPRFGESEMSLKIGAEGSTLHHDSVVFPARLFARRPTLES